MCRAIYLSIRHVVTLAAVEAAAHRPIEAGRGLYNELDFVQRCSKSPVPGVAGGGGGVESGQWCTRVCLEGGSRLKF